MLLYNIGMELFCLLSRPIQVNTLFRGSNYVNINPNDYETVIYIGQGLLCWSNSAHILSVHQSKFTKFIKCMQDLTTLEIGLLLSLVV